MTQVAVIHSAFEDSPRTVAFVEVGDRAVEDALEYAREIIKKKEGIHHFHTFDETNIIEILIYLVKKCEANIEYFSGFKNRDLHFALRKN